MQIDYKTKKLEEACTNAAIARKMYGKSMAYKIHQRIDEISAADTVETLVQSGIGHCHPLKGNRQGQYAMNLVQPYRLIFIIKGENIEIAEIQEIVDYH